MEKAGCRQIYLKPGEYKQGGNNAVKAPITNKRIRASLQNLHPHKLTPTDFYCFQSTTYFSIWTCGKKIHPFLKKNTADTSQSLFCSYNKIICQV